MHFTLLAWATPSRPIQTPTLTRRWRHIGQLSEGLSHWVKTMPVLAAGLLCPVHGQAAGGHHAVDDASILDPGQCQVEAWLEQGRQRELQHVGPACHLLGLEFGLNVDRYTTKGEPVSRSGGPQIKWAQELQTGLSWGFVWSATWQSTSPGFAGQALVLPLSWSPREGLTMHVNVGRDFHRQTADQGRYGIALEWQPTSKWQGLIEHWDDGVRAQHRFGVRHLLNESLSVDISRAQPRGAPREAWWSLGLNWAFSR